MNPTSQFTLMPMPELRMWAILGLLCHPHLTENADGSVFLSNEISWSIFESARDLHKTFGTVDYADIFMATGGDFEVAIALSMLPDIFIREEMAVVYLEKLGERYEYEPEY